MCETNQVAADFFKSVNLVIEKVKIFCYLRNVLSTEGGVQEAVTT